MVTHSRYRQPISIEMIIPSSVYFLIFASIGVFLLSTVIPGYVASKTNLREILREL